MGIRSLLRTEYGQYIKNKAITHNLDALSHTAILATGEKPEETHPGWTRMEDLSTQLTELHKQEMVLDLELSEAQKEEAELLETQQLLAELQTTVPSNVLEAKAAAPAKTVDAGQWLKCWKDPRSWQAGFSWEDWEKENAAASVGKAAKELDTSSTSQKLPAPRLTGPRPANVAQAVVMRLKRRGVTVQMCQAATDKVSAIQARLSNIHEQQQQAFNELVQGWQTVLEKAYSKGGSAGQQAVEVVLSVHPDADTVQQLQEALIQSQMQVAAAREEAAAARARAEVAHAAQAALLQQQQQEKASAVAVNLIIQEPSISLSVNVIEPQRQQQDEGVVQLLQDRLANAEAELLAVKHQQRPVTLQVLVPSDAAELEVLHARLAAAEAALAAERQAKHLQHTDKGDALQSQDEAAADAAPAAAAAFVPCAGSVSEVPPATPRVDLGLCGQQLAMVAGQASVAASSSAASYESCCDSSSVHGSVCNGSSSELGEALSCERLGAAASAAGDAGSLEMTAIEEKAPAAPKAKASAADGASQQSTAPVTAASNKKQQQTGAAAGAGAFDSSSDSSKWLEIVVAADFVADQGHQGHQQQKQQQGKPRVSDDLNPEGLQDKDSGSVLASLRNSVMEGYTSSGGASVVTEAPHSTAGGSKASAPVHSSSNGSRAGRYTCMPFTAPPAAAILAGSVGFTAALADKMGLLPAGSAGDWWAGGLWSAVNDASSTAASSVGGWISSTWGGWQ